MKFNPGDYVRTVTDDPMAHSRLPGYLRGRSGRIVGCYGAFGHPGERAQGNAHAPAQAVYTVAFEASDVWGADAPPRTEILADLFESYLEAL